MGAGRVFHAHPGVSHAARPVRGLENYAYAFIDAANKLIQQARRHEPRIGQHVHFDGTAFHSHASLEHACPDANTTAEPPALASARSWPRPTTTTSKTSVTPTPASPSRPTPARSPTARAPARLSDEHAAALGLDPTTYGVLIRAGHIYKCRDKSAGGRRYAATKRKDVFWLGGYFMPGVDDSTRAPPRCTSPRPPPGVQRAPAAYEKTCVAIDDEPITAVMDRGFHIKARLEELHLCGTAPIVPFRAPHAGWTPENLQTEMIDSDGTPRFATCGRPEPPRARGLGLDWAEGVPRIRYRCAIYDTDECLGRTQSIAVLDAAAAAEPDPSRTSRLHHDLLESHQNMEGVFAAWRERYKVAGNDLGSRIRRRAGVSAQNLRAAAALLIEWFRMDLRNGWMGSHRHRNTQTPKERTGGIVALDHVLRHRDANELDLPYRGDIESSARPAARQPAAVRAAAGGRSAIPRTRPAARDHSWAAFVVSRPRGDLNRETKTAPERPRAAKGPSWLLWLSCGAFRNRNLNSGNSGGGIRTRDLRVMRRLKEFR